MSAKDVNHIENCMTPVQEAVEIIKKRQGNVRLRAHIETYLGHDIPEYFENGPILYLARDVATPNFEILRFIELTKSYGLPVVIGQDEHDTFTPEDSLEHALGVMPITIRVTAENEAVTEDVEIINVGESAGKPFKHIQTVFGANFVEFHNELLHAVYPKALRLYNSGSWIDRHHRGDLVEYYKKVLALSLVHGVFFEFYEPCDAHFASSVFVKAFNFVTREFGEQPLVCHLMHQEFEKNRTCEAYPSIVYRMVKDRLTAPQ